VLGWMEGFAEVVRIEDVRILDKKNKEGFPSYAFKLNVSIKVCW